MLVTRRVNEGRVPCSLDPLPRATVPVVKTINKRIHSWQTMA